MSFGQGGPSGPRAGFWRRFGAAVSDAIIVFVIELILRAVLGGAGGIISFVFSLAYYIVLEGGPSGQTLGKKLLGIRLVDTNTGGPIGYGRATIRYFGRIVSAIVIFLGYLWMLWDSEKQCWHDKFAGDYVVPVSAYPVGGGQATSTGASTWR